MAEARQVLRQILRVVDRHVTSVNGNTTWRQHILQEFRQSVGVEDPALRDQLLQQAKDYAFLVNSVQEYKVRAVWLWHPESGSLTLLGIPCRTC